MSARSVQLGRVLNDRYRIERELGEGGMAVVYLAADLQQHRSVALKVLRPELAGLIGPERFLREVDLAGKLSHPHIVPLFDAGEADGLPYYVMPFIDGETLREKLTREGQLSIDEALQITREVADALSYAHALGVIHRDVKPENIMLSRGHALLADFGIARALVAAGAGEKLTGTGMAIGTVDYMSPEQALGNADVDARSDQYSLACVLYEMLAGAPPFAAPNPQAVLAKQLADPVPPIRTVRNTVPAPMEAAMLSALAKSKADRFPSVGAFVEALEGKRPSPWQPSPGSMAVVRPRERRSPQWGIRLVIAGVVVASSGIVAMRMGWLQPDRAPTSKKVVVAFFENQTGDTTRDPIGAMTADWITRGLTETGLVDVADSRLAMLNPEGSLARSPWKLASIAPQLAERVGADIVVSGRFYRERDSLVFQASISDVNTQKVLRSVGPSAGPDTAPLVGIEAIRQRVIGSLATIVDPRLSDYMKSASQPPTYAAYQEYMEGRAAQVRNDWPNALKHLYAAASADSNYTLPLVDATEVLEWEGKCDQVDSILRVLAPRRMRMAQYDRIWLDRNVAKCHGDLTGAHEAAQRLQLLAPRSEWTALLLAHDALSTNHTHEVIRVLEKLNPERGELRGEWFYYIALTLAEHVQGDYQQELKDAERGRRQYPSDLAVLAGEVRALIVNGRVADVNSRLDEALGDAGQVMQMAGYELAGHGDSAAARPVWDRAIAWYRDRLRADQSSEDSRAALAGVLYEGQHYPEARTFYAALAAEHPDNPDYQCALGVLAARQGQTADAERIANALAARQEQRPVWLTQCRAGIAAILGARDKSVDLLRQANEQGYGFNYFWRHVEPDFASLRGYAPYEKMMQPKN